jgi:hypothetical protein
MAVATGALGQLALSLAQVVFGGSLGACGSTFDRAVAVKISMWMRIDSCPLGFAEVESKSGHSDCEGRLQSSDGA